jgi:hypothetical protein
LLHILTPDYPTFTIPAGVPAEFKQRDVVAIRDLLTQRLDLHSRSSRPIDLGEIHDQPAQTEDGYQKGQSPGDRCAEPGNAHKNEDNRSAR